MLQDGGKTFGLSARLTNSSTDFVFTNPTATVDRQTGLIWLMYQVRAEVTLRIMFCCCSVGCSCAACCSAGDVCAAGMKHAPTAATALQQHGSGAELRILRLRQHPAVGLRQRHALGRGDPRLSQRRERGQRARQCGILDTQQHSTVLQILGMTTYMCEVGFCVVAVGAAARPQEPPSRPAALSRRALLVE